MESLEGGVGKFVAEAGIEINDYVPLFDISAYPKEQQEIIAECNKRIDEANSKYRIAKIREDMFAKGLKAGMYYCTFDRDENLLSFEFNDETVAESFRDRLNEWLDKDSILAAVEEHGSSTMEFYSASANRWYNVMKRRFMWTLFQKCATANSWMTS